MLSSLLSNDCVHMKSFHKMARLITLLLLLQQRVNLIWQWPFATCQEEVLAPLTMIQLQTDYITKTMVRKLYVASSRNNSNIGQHKRQKSETTEHANNNRSSRYPTTLMIVTMVATIKMKVHTIVKSTMVVTLPPTTTMMMMMTRYHPWQHCHHR